MPSLSRTVRCAHEECHYSAYTKSTQTDGKIIAVKNYSQCFLVQCWLARQEVINFRRFAFSSDNKFSTIFFSLALSFGVTQNCNIILVRGKSSRWMCVVLTHTHKKAFAINNKRAPKKKVSKLFARDFFFRWWCHKFFDTVRYGKILLHARKLKIDFCHAGNLIYFSRFAMINNSVESWKFVCKLWLIHKHNFTEWMPREYFMKF